jgi:nucleoside-diphosphate kinase
MPGTERTLVLVKPDGVQRQLIGRILARYEARGLKVVGLKLVRVDRDLAERHYAAHREKPFFAGLVEFIISGRSSPSRSTGRMRSRSSARSTARPAARGGAGTIRGDFALETAQNIVHASDSPEAAAHRAGAVVRSRGAARLRARRRPVGARPERLGEERLRLTARPTVRPADGASRWPGGRHSRTRAGAELVRDRDRRDRFGGRARSTERAGRRGEASTASRRPATAVVNARFASHVWRSQWRSAVVSGRASGAATASTVRRPGRRRQPDHQQPP